MLVDHQRLVRQELRSPKPLPKRDHGLVSVRGVDEHHGVSSANLGKRSWQTHSQGLHAILEAQRVGVLGDGVAEVAEVVFV